MSKERKKSPKKKGPIFFEIDEPRTIKLYEKGKKKQTSRRIDSPAREPTPCLSSAKNNDHYQQLLTKQLVTAYRSIVIDAD